MKRIVGLGNAVLDTSIEVSAADIEAMGLQKGSMQLVDEAEWDRVSQAFAHHVPARVAGGSCANTMAALGYFGTPAAFLGKVHRDAAGAAFVQSMVDVGVGCPIPPLEEGPKTAQCLVLITPDAQRTMLTYLGACLHLDEQDIQEDMLQGTSILMIEGYLWDSPKARKAIHKGVAWAKANGAHVAFSLSDPFCVQRHHADFKTFIQENVTLLFANEEEAGTLFCTNSLSETIAQASGLEKMVVITRSEKGSVIVDLHGHVESVAAFLPSPRLIDTTGAGDIYAAAFLHGVFHNMDLITCATLGSRAAAEVISHFGARPQAPLDALSRI